MDNLPKEAAEISAGVGYQRLALQIVGSLKVPISKKKEPMSWEGILALVLDIRTEVGLTEHDLVRLPEKVSVEVSSDVKITEA